MEKLIDQNLKDICQKIRFNDLFDTLDSLNENLSLFVPNNLEKIALDTYCVINDDFSENIQGLTYCIGIYDVQDVVENLKHQISHPINKDCLRALIFYIKNDCFIDMTLQEKDSTDAVET